MNRFRPSRILAAALLVMSAGQPGFAERFDDVIVLPESVVSGQTYHGYREFRVSVENQSARATHQVTLIFPESSYNFGDSISRLSRTLILPPGARVQVPIWQPPLPINGNSNFKIVIDDVPAGTVVVPDAPRHALESHMFGSPDIPVAILVSRSLNFDELTRALKTEHPGYSANMAAGPPDAGGLGGNQANGWRPDDSAPGPHWIELDYDRPIVANKISIHLTRELPRGGEIVLMGSSRTNLTVIPITSSAPSSRGSRAIREYSFPPTSDPVKTVRLELKSAYAGSIGIDAVGLTGPSEKSPVWAGSARASSENDPGKSPGGGPETRRFLRAEIPVTEWSDYWLSYTPFDAILLSASDLAAMSPSTSACLWRYAECGGNLFITGTAAIPEPWRSLQGGRPENPGGTSVGFGRCYVLRDSNTSSFDPAEARVLMNSAGESARLALSQSGGDQINQTFPVIDNYHIPVRSTVFIMFGFVLLIGPVNIIVLNCSNRRTWLLWTIPAMSFVTCLMVFVYVLLREGVTPTVRIEGLTLLDQASHRASSIGLTAFYCPLTPSQGLAFDVDTEATPLLRSSDNFGFRRSVGVEREVDWSQAQHLGRGWIMARVPAHFQLRKSENRRERLEVDRAGENLSVVNGLGAPIRSLWLADRAGRIYTGSGIAAGQRAILTPAAGTIHLSARLGPRGLLQQVGSDPGPGVVSADAVEYLLPGTYMAELDHDPFLENGLGQNRKSVRLRSRAVVYGILEPTLAP